MDVPPYFINNDVSPVLIGWIIGLANIRTSDPGASVRTLPAQGANKRLAHRACEGAH
jgi:hypothetical protein